MKPTIGINQEGQKKCKYAIRAPSEGRGGRFVARGSARGALAPAADVRIIAGGASFDGRARVAFEDPRKASGGRAL